MTSTYELTGVDFQETSNSNKDINIYKIPPSVNYIAIRESFLSEAPFVKKGGGGLWRTMIDSKCFYEMLCATYNLVSTCISDAGSFDYSKLKSMNNIQLQQIGKSFSDIYYTFNQEERDIFMPKLPEVMTYLLINCLHSGIPKHYRMYNSLRFRELTLDYFGEMYTGIRSTSTHTNREWLFNDCNDLPIFLTTPDAKKEPDVTISSAASRYRLSNSPLVAMRLGTHLSKNYDKIVGMRMTMSHLPDRALMTLKPEENILAEGKARHKYFNTLQAKQELKKIKNTKKNVMNKLSSDKNQYNKDIHAMKEHYDDMMKVMAKQKKEAMLHLQHERQKLQASFKSTR